MTDRSRHLDPERLVQHVDVTRDEYAFLDDFVADLGRMAFSARDLGRAAEIWCRALKEDGTTVFLCLAGSMVSAGLRRTIARLVEGDLVDAVVSTGANLVDQDFFESMGYRHYQGEIQADDRVLQKLEIDRIYDTYIDERELKECDGRVGELLEGLEPRPYPSWVFTALLGRDALSRDDDGVLATCARKQVPVFSPAFQDSSAGFGFVQYLHRRTLAGDDRCVSFDASRDFFDLSLLKAASAESAIVMLGGGVPKNYIQDTVVASDLMELDAPLHKYAIQMTVADVRDGALSSSTLQEAMSWGKVDATFEQMVYGECATTFPMLAGAVWHRLRRQGFSRKGRGLLAFLEEGGHVEFLRRRSEARARG